MTEGSSTPRYCARCPGYGEHDTAHHDGPVAVGDEVTVEIDGREQTGVVREVRGQEARVDTRKTMTWVPFDQIRVG